MKRYQAIILAVAAFVGSSYVGAHAAVKLDCEGMKATIEGNILTVGGKDYGDGYYVTDLKVKGDFIMIFSRTEIEAVVLRSTAHKMTMTVTDENDIDVKRACNYIGADSDR